MSKIARRCAGGVILLSILGKAAQDNTSSSEELSPSERRTESELEQEYNEYTDQVSAAELAQPRHERQKPTLGGLEELLACTEEIGAGAGVEFLRNLPTHLRQNGDASWGDALNDNHKDLVNRINFFDEKTRVFLIKTDAAADVLNAERTEEHSKDTAGVINAYNKVVEQVEIDIKRYDYKIEKKKKKWGKLNRKIMKKKIEKKTAKTEEDESELKKIQESITELKKKKTIKDDEIKYIVLKKLVLGRIKIATIKTMLELEIDPKAGTFMTEFKKLWRKTVRNVGDCFRHPKDAIIDGLLWIGEKFVKWHINSTLREMGFSNQQTDDFGKAIATLLKSWDEIATPGALDTKNPAAVGDKMKEISDAVCIIYKFINYYAEEIPSGDANGTLGDEIRLECFKALFPTTINVSEIKKIPQLFELAIQKNLVPVGGLAETLGDVVTHVTTHISLRLFFNRMLAKNPALQQHKGLADQMRQAFVSVLEDSNGYKTLREKITEIVLAKLRGDAPEVETERRRLARSSKPFYSEGRRLMKKLVRFEKEFSG